MTLFRPSRSDDHLSNYWNALVRNAPAEELARLARLVEPSEIAAIERARAAHARYEPDPAFARRLERTLMNTAISPIAGTIPQPRVSPPSRNGTRDPGSVTRRGASGPRPRSRWALSPALGIGLVILLILGSLGGAWLANTGEDEGRRMMAPIVATPEPEASPDVPMYRGNAERTGVMPGPGIAGQPVELWRAGVPGIIRTAPALVDGVLYFGAGDGGLYASDAITGERVWVFQGASPIMASPAEQDGIVYAGSTDGTLYAVDGATGTEVWSFPGAQSEVAVAIVGNAVYTGGGDGFIYALDAATGEELWRSPLSAEASRSPSVSDGVVYLGSADGVLHTFDAETGEPGWNKKLIDDGIITTTVVHRGVVYEGTIDGEENYLVALDAATGEELWRFESELGGGFYSAATDGQTVYTGSDDDNFYALDAATGEELWRFETSEDVRSAAGLVDDTLYVAVFDGYLYALDASNGAERWRFAIEGEVLYGPVVSGGVAYLGTTFGYFYAIGGSGEPATPVASPSVMVGAAPIATGVPVSGSGTGTPAAAQDIAVELAWQSTGGPDPLLFPNNGLAVAPDGTIWVIDAGNNRFQLFSPDGAYLETWGEAGDGEGQLNFLRSPGDLGNSVGDIAFAPDGSFYVTNSGNKRVQHFAADRTFIRAWGSFGAGDGQFVDPIGVAVGPDGNVYVIDDQRDDVQVFDPEGTYLFTFGEPGTGPGQLAETGSLTIDAAGNVYVADFGNHRVQHFAADGTFIMAFGEFGQEEGQFNLPIDVAVDANGTLYVTDLDNNRVQVFTPEGAFVAAWSAADDGQGALAVPGAIAVDAHGGVYVTQIVAGTIQKFEVTLPAMPGATPDS